MLEKFKDLKRRRELLIFFKKLGYDFNNMPTADLEVLKRKYDIDFELASLSDDYSRICECLLMISRRYIPENALSEIKMVISNDLRGIEMEAKQIRSDDTFKTVEKCQDYLKKLLEIIEDEIRGLKKFKNKI